ncbi:MAG: Fur family transcriptional regulator [Deltaproteobacteria bacterium]|nr:MAG: Fur family transcriptional regulator [Deltaproteobacteria bacterium]
MRPIHVQEKEQFRKLFKQEKIDRFDDRFKILEIFLTTERHMTVDEISRLLSEHGQSYPPAFIIETMRLLCDYGFAQKNHFQNGAVRYEHRHPRQHHDHMICTKCGKIIEFENQQMEQLQYQIATNYDFHMLQHKMEIYGICGDCINIRDKEMPLTEARPGERVIIESFKGGMMAKTRLLSMGLRPGDLVEIISHHSHGQLVISADCKRFVLGQGLANKILVRHTDQAPDPDATCEEPAD